MSFRGVARCAAALGLVLMGAALPAAELPSGEAPRWLNASGRPNAVAREALALLAGAAADGLDPADYQAAQLEAAAPAGPGVTPAAIDWSAALDAGMLRYLRHLHQGRVTPRDLGFGVVAPLTGAQDIGRSLQAAINAGRLDPAVAELTPPIAQYARLRSALAQYRALVAAAPFAPLPKATKVRPGEAWDGAAALRQRLVAFGDLAADAGASSGPAVYDEPLAGAVRRFQQRHGLDADGVLGRVTLAKLDVPPAQRVRQIELALERLRWLPRGGGRPFIAINIPMFRLWAWDPGAALGSPAVQMGVIVGRALRTQTPVFADEMTHLILRPYWNVPRSILVNEVLPAAERNPHYLQRNDMELVAGQGDDARPRAATPENLAAARQGGLRVRQRPGPHNSLGLVKFIFPNDDNVYLHGTPATQLFGRSRRDFSHGCVRVEDPVGLASWLLKDQPEWTRERVVAVMDGSQTMQVNLRQAVPVLLYYITAAVTPDDGKLHFADDIYGHDAKLERALARLRADKSVRGNPMRPRQPPEQAQSRRKPELGLRPSEDVQRRVGRFWGLTRRAGVPRALRGVASLART